jgi:hypothetical protein
MKLFISWSGPRSEKVAVALRDWIPCVLQSAEPFISKDIGAGREWLREILETLQNSQVGIICITPESVEKPWLYFEAGALMKELAGNKNLIVPYLYDCEEEALKAPLAHFQTVVADKAGTFKLIKTLHEQMVNREKIANLGQTIPNEITLRRIFEKWWPELGEALNGIPKPVAADTDEMGQYSSFYYGPNKTLRTGEVFQDFQTVDKFDEKGNVNAIQNTWADASAGSKIEAKTRPRESKLVVAFENKPSSYPCNIAIRGKDEAPLLNNPYRPFLLFGVRLQGERPKASPPIVVGVRITNGFFQHWLYLKAGGSSYYYSPVEETWTVVKIDISERKRWRKFESEGNPDGPVQARFRCICSVVLEIGPRGSDRPDAEGCGTVEIGPLVLADSDSNYMDKYLPNE